MCSQKVLFAGIFFLLLTGALSAHPHIWVEVNTEVPVSGGMVEGIWVNWTFDEEFSQMILADHDPGGTGKISPAQVPGIKASYFDALKNLGYYTHLALGKKELPVPKPQNFTATVLASGKVTYRFFFPLKLRLSPQVPLAIAFYDDSYYTDLEFSTDNPVVVEATDGTATKVTLRPDKASAFWGGYVIPVFAYITSVPS